MERISIASARSALLLVIHTSGPALPRPGGGSPALGEGVLRSPRPAQVCRDLVRAESDVLGPREGAGRRYTEQCSDPLVGRSLCPEKTRLSPFFRLGFHANTCSQDTLGFGPNSGPRIRRARPRGVVV